MERLKTALLLGIALVLLPVVTRAQSPFLCALHEVELTQDGARSAKVAVGVGDEPSRLEALVVFAAFADEAAPGALAPIWAHYLLDARRTGSLSHFYKQMSFDQLNIGGRVLPTRYISPRRAAEYVAADANSSGSYEVFARDILAQVDRTTDFGLFDNDGPDGEPNSGDDDGVVDYIFLNLLSVPRGFIRGGATGIAGLGLGKAYRTEDLRPDGSYIEISGATRHGSLLEEGSFSQTVGVMAHEFGHALGLPDLYDTRYANPAEDSAGIGRWGLMAWGAHGWDGGDGPVGFSAWSLERLGWIGQRNERLSEVQAAGELRIEDLYAGGRIYKVHLPVSRRETVLGNGATLTEVEAGYLLLEQRVRGEHNYYNRGMPGEGLLVWHVKPERVANAEEGNKVVDLVCADGLRAAGDDLDRWAHDAVYRSAEGGNQGDAGDLFDGVRYTTLDGDSNPSIHSLGVFGYAALRDLAMNVERAGRASRVAIQPPIWAGDIGEQVDWSGVVLVDGDISVRAEGGIKLRRGTEVRFAAVDALHSGLHREQIEVLIEGDFKLPNIYSGRAPHVEMRPMRAGDEWFGVIIDPVSSGEVEVPEGSLQLVDSARGIYLPGAPEGVHGLHVQGVEVVDAGRGSSAGNGDGRLDPGETAEVALVVDNWSLTPYRDMTIEVSWENSLLQRGWDGGSRRIVEPFSLGAGGGRRIELPGGLRLSSDAVGVKSVALSLRVLDGRAVRWSGEVELPLGHLRYRPQVELKTSLPAQGGQAVISTKEPVGVQLEVRAGEVLAAELVAYDKEQRAPVAIAPMQRLGNGSFRAEFSAEVPGLYTLAARLHGANGAVVFAEERLELNALFARWQPVLVVYNRWGRSGQREFFAAALDEVLAERGVGANYLADTQAWLADDALLQRYVGPGRAVLWLGRSFSSGTTRALANFLASGGHLLVSSPTFHWSLGDSLRALLPFARASGTDASALSGVQSFAEMELPTVSHSALGQLAAGSEPLFVDAAGDTAAVRVDNGIYRMAYYAFDLYRFNREMLGEMLVQSADFLLAARTGGKLLLQMVEDMAPQVFLDPVRPQLRVRNIGTAMVPDFSLAYRVYGAQGALAARYVQQRALRPGESRIVDMPSWTPQREGAYRFVFSARGRDSGIVVEELERPLTAIDVRGQFAIREEVEAAQGNGAAFFDCDGDGDLDMYIARIEGNNLLYRNDEGQLREVAEQAGLADADRSRALAIGDYDGDGDLDLYLVNETSARSPGENHLFENLGDGRFVDNTRSVGGEDLVNANSGRSSGFFDYDGDGDLDLYLVNAKGGLSSVNRLFRNTDNLYEDVAAEVGLADADNGRGLAIGDYDGDGDPDLYIASHLGGDTGALYENDLAASGTFIARDRELGIEAGQFEVGAVFGDTDGDGDLDLFVSSETEQSALWRNLGKDAAGDMRFERVEVDLGERVIGAALLDYDNDGDLDLATTAMGAGYAGDQLFHNLGAGDFVEMGALLGLRGESAGRGLAIGDYDGDGQQDMLVADNEHTTLYRNRLEPVSWLQVELRGGGANSNALGARVELSVAGQHQTRELQSSYGYSSQVQPWLHFGLGAADQVDSLRVKWPDGSESIAREVRGNQRLSLAHPGGAPAELALPAAASLGIAHPNPFNAETLIPFHLNRAGRVRLEIYNALGQRVRVLLDKAYEAGAHSMRWDSRDRNGQSVASGVYFYRLTATGKEQTRRLLLVK